jgi:hypothetical protein
LFDVLIGITKKCYVMIEPKLLFDELMSPFNIMPLLEFSLQGGVHTKHGIDFLKVLIWNLFVAEPSQADLDVMEINFGFTVVSIAGVNVQK